MAVVEASLVMHASERQFSRGHVLLVYATLRELEEQGLMKEQVSLDTVNIHLTVSHNF